MSQPDKECQISRWLMVMAIVLYPVWSAIYRALFPGVYDPVAQRLQVSAAIALLLGVSYLGSFRGRIRLLMGVAYLVLASHFLYLVAANGMSPPYVVGAFITFLAIDVSIGNRVFLVIFSCFLVFAASILAWLARSPESGLFLFGLLTIQLVAFVSLNWRLGLEASLRAAQASLLSADRYKDEFLSVVSHELRTPLNFISGFASILLDGLDGPLSAPQAEHVAKILYGADRMLSLVDNLLEVGRMQAGKFSVSPHPLRYGVLVEEVVSSIRPLADEKGLLLTVEPGFAGEIEVDGRRIAQTLTNLVGNAIKFTPAGGRVTVRTCAQGPVLLTEVADTGPGISQDDLPRLFVPFSQLDMSPTRRAGGVGLGLSICRTIVEAHGGRIGVDGPPGGGATFWFTLPMPDRSPAPGDHRS